MAIEFAEVTMLEREPNRDDDGDKTMLQVVITDTQDVQDAEMINQPGEDSAPLNGTMVLLICVDESFKLAIAADDGIEKTAEQGEKEIYSAILNGTTIEKLSSLKLDKDGHIDLQPDATIKLAGDSRDAAGVGHEITITAQTDSALYTWLSAVGTATGAGPPPTSITGKINSGTSKVRLP